MTAKLKAAASLVFFVVLVAAAASGGALFKPGAWYAGIAKPSWTPPNWLFGPVWSVLYVMIAFAGWLVWRRGPRGWALAAWGIGLFLNFAWSWLFFGQHWIAAAAVNIVALWLSIVAFLAATRCTNTTAFWLFLPYLLWVSFATALNLAIWRLNP